MAVVTTTIKVPVVLRDRLAARAQKDAVPLYVVIEQAMSSIEEGDFWAAVHAENREIGGDERARYIIDGTLGDDLDDADDHAISAEDGW